jgi:hypothetical protein
MSVKLDLQHDRRRHLDALDFYLYVDAAGQ